MDHHQGMASATPHLSVVETAGVTRRTLAMALDSVPALTLWWGATVSLTHTSEVAATSQWNLLDRSVDLFNTTPSAILWPLVWLCLASILWHALTVALFGTSPGKRIVGLSVSGPTGEPPGVFRACVHALMRPLTSACLALGPLWALADPERRTLYDRLSGVYVIVTPDASQPRNRRR